MNRKHLSTYAASPTRRLDAVMNGYLAWREESLAVAASYQSWTCAAGHERGIAFDAYIAALDREERAACEYRRLVEQVVLQG